MNLFIMKKKKYQFDFLFDKFMYLLIFIPFIIITFKANIDLTEAGYTLDMDERLTFYKVKEILHPKGIYDFFINISFGGDLRYGRLLWNLTAIISYFPERIFGPAGQIFASREILVLLQILSGLFLSFLLNKKFLRYLFLISYLCIPYTSYFNSLPKPEPLAIFFLVLFMYISNFKNYSYGWHFLLIGAIVGMKISFVFFGIIVFVFHVILNKESKPNELIKGILFVIVGFTVINPIFAVIFLPMIILYLGKHFAYNYLRIINILIFCAYYLFNFQNISKLISFYIESTILNTSFLGDNSNISWKDWILFFHQEYLLKINTIYLILFILVYVGLMLKLFTSAHISLKDKFILVITNIAFASLFFPPIFTTQRLWGHYLYPGYIFLLFLTFLIIDYIFIIKKNFKRSLFIYFLYCHFIISIVIFDIQNVVAEYREYNILGSRTKSQEYETNKKSLDITTDYAGNLAKTLERDIIIDYSPRLFYLENNIAYRVNLYYGPYLNFSSFPDVIVIDESYTPQNRNISSELNDFDLYSQSFSLFHEYVVSLPKIKNCKYQYCYKISIVLPNRALLLERYVNPSRLN